ncbi:hypothetical protein HMPREF6485_0838 [Segatella buccae ATCC 33574]|uniref:Uncharacterized protein n=1 Tax=Segatella buccae ATCC 33574 TaxID=873513 RepID=E6K5J8_9BACT|nr:hypothetical protein HMPREF6485_0838 [Segatella buccae ATCC 33574]
MRLPIFAGALGTYEFCEWAARLAKRQSDIATKVENAFMSINAVKLLV